MLKYRRGELESPLYANAAMEVVFPDPGRVILRESCFIGGFKKLAATVIVIMAVLTLTGCGDAGLLSASSASKSSSATHAGQESKKSIKRGAGENEEGKIWFDEEPEDPLEKLVYASQQFVNKPLQLRPIEAGEGIPPDFVGKPEICDPQAVERLALIGVRQSTSAPTYMSYRVRYCSYYIYDRGKMTGIMSINMPRHPFTNAVKNDFGINLLQVGNGVGEEECVGSFLTLYDNYLYATYTHMSDLNNTKKLCYKVSLARQIFINIQGGKYATVSAGIN